MGTLSEVKEKSSKKEETTQKEKSAPKKKGRKPGAIGYTEGDLEGLLESVRVVQPVIDAEWV